MRKEASRKENAVPEAMSFYFDFNCPYSWIASERVMSIAARHMRDVRWRAIPSEMLCHKSAPCGFPPSKTPGVDVYIQRDLGRLLRLYNLDAVKPIPISKGASIALSCGFHWIRQEQGREAARAYAMAAFRARFRDGRDVADPDVAADIACETGNDRGKFMDAISDPQWQALLGEEVKRVQKDGIFALPFVVVDGEPFWGSDRLDMIDDWLSRGGW